MLFMSRTVPDNRKFNGGRTVYDPHDVRVRNELVRLITGKAEIYNWESPTADYGPHSFDQEIVRLNTGALAVYCPMFPDLISRPLPKRAVKYAEEHYDMSAIRDVDSAMAAPVELYRYFVLVDKERITLHELSAVGGIVNAESRFYSLSGRWVRESLDTYFAVVNMSGVANSFRTHAEKGTIWVFTLKQPIPDLYNRSWFDALNKFKALAQQKVQKAWTIVTYEEA